MRSRCIRDVFFTVTLCSSTLAWPQTFSVLKTFEGLAFPSSRLIRDKAGNLYGSVTTGGTFGRGAIFKLAADGQLSILHSFDGPNGDNPQGDLLHDKAGNLYGTTVGGGAGQGTAYKLAPDGTFTLLHTFGYSVDGGFPNGGLIQDRSGNLYGTTSSGGPLGEGTVFELSPDGTFTVLHSFAFDNNGFLPSCCLVRDHQGNLYGTTSSGGSGGGRFGGGTIFKLAPDGTHTVLYNFTGGSDGAEPSGLRRVPGGDLIGITRSGGSASEGTLFKLATDSTFTVLVSFSAYPEGGLTPDQDGNLYGVTPQGGSGRGSLFKLAVDGTFSVLHSFTGDDGDLPRSRPVLDGAGNLYGSTFQGGPGGEGTVFRLAPDGTLTELHDFRLDNPNGLALDSRGNLFGTSQRGGTGSGSVFELSPANGTYSVLHAFGVMDGINPFASPILDGGGNLYGTTSIAGPPPTPGGTAFRLAADGTYTVLHGFGGFLPPSPGSPPTFDGSRPLGSLVLDAGGNLYGTTSQGGAPPGAGVIFKLAPGGGYTILHNFGFVDGLMPVAGLVVDGGGNLFGTAPQGGSLRAGVIFKMASSGTFTVLHDFAGGSDGANPSAALALDSSGNLYGTTSATVFKLAPDGTYTVLHSFAFVEGSPLASNLVVDSSGNLYGTTSAGGGSNLGTVFKLAQDGTYTIVHSFSGPDGASPLAGLVLSGSVLYGTTSAGGPLGGGSVFQIGP